MRPSVAIRIRWQGADLDRITGAAHAELHESIADFLGRWPDWTWRPEVSFSIWGERGVITSSPGIQAAGAC